MKACPNQTFLLPETQEFNINDHFNKVGEYRINHHEEIDPTFATRINWILQPKIHMDELQKNVPTKNERSPNVEDINFIFIWIMILIVILILMVCGGVICIWIVLKKKRLQPTQMNLENIEILE